MERQVGIPRRSIINAGAEKSPPNGGGIIELERGGMWFLHCLVGFWNEERGRSGRERPSSRRGEAAVMGCCWL